MTDPNPPTIDAKHEAEYLRRCAEACRNLQRQAHRSPKRGGFKIVALREVTPGFVPQASESRPESAPHRGLS
jgi:hypothetical protein